jgi:uncharacterized protein (DUF1499 family)
MYTAIKLSIAFLLISSCSGDKDKIKLGLRQTKTTGRSARTLAPCPESPNCVTSYIHNNDRGHYIPPIKFTILTAKAKKRIVKYLSEHSRIKIVKNTGSYIRYEYTSLIFRFIDDVELYFVSEGIMHFRSASRIGYSDLGANKSHIKDISTAIRKRF